MTTKSVSSDESASGAVQHPTREQLFAFANGRVDSPREQEDIANHLDGCESCLSLLDQAHADPLVDHLRSISMVVEPQSTGMAQARTLLTGKLPTPNVPERLGRYQLESPIGEGGFSVVWKAYDPQLARHVALKIPRIQPQKPAQNPAQNRRDEDRFQREAMAVAALDHPNIVAIYEVGCHHDLHYIAQSLCDGPPLSVYLENHTPSYEQAAWLVRELAAATDHAHQRGVLHCDLKPANVLLQHDDSSPLGYEPKIVDFGLAKILNERQDANAASRTERVGTLHYMSPEAYETGKPVAASDIYALGTILYELLAGQTPFAAESPASLLRKTIEEPPPRPSTLRPSTARPVPRDLETICITCLAKRPADRYRSAAELAEDLTCFLEGRPIHAQPATWNERLVKWARRYPALAGMIVLTCLLVLLTITVSVLAAIHSQSQQRQLVAQLQDTLTAEREAKDAAALARRRLFDVNLSQLSLSWASRKTGRRQQATRAAREAVSLAQEIDISPQQYDALRNAFIASAAQFDLKFDVSWQGFTNSDQTCCATSSDGECYAITRNQTVELRRMADNQLIHAWPFSVQGETDSDWRLSLKFSPGGKYLAASGDRSAGRDVPCRVWNLETFEQVLEQESSASFWQYAYDFSPDDTLFAHASSRETLDVYATATGELQHSFDVKDGCHSVEFHPDKPWIAVGTGSGVSVVNFQSDEIVDTYATGSSTRLAWRPRHDHLIIVSGNQHLELRNVETRTTKALTLPLRSRPYQASYSPPGDLLVVSGWAEDTQIFDANSYELLLEADRSAIAFSRDGKYLSFGAVGSQIGRWCCTETSLCTLVETPLRRTESNLAFAPTDSRMLVIPHSQGMLVWDAALQRQVADLPVGTVEAVRFQKGGQRILIGGPETVGECELQQQGTQWSAGEFVPFTDVGRAPYDSVSITSDFRTRFVAANDASWLRSATDDQQPVSSRLSLTGLWLSELSDDHRWLAISYWHGKRTFVIDLVRRKTVATIQGIRGRPRFSPDGKWLAIGFVDRNALLDTETWSERTFPRTSTGTVSTTPAFSADGRTLAIAESGAVITLLDIDKTGTFVKSLELRSPRRVMLDRLELSHDFRFLAASSHPNGALVWDFAEVQQELEKADLAWPYPSHQVDDDVSALTILVDENR